MCFSQLASAKDFVREREPYPQVNDESWVLVEIWPRIPNFHVVAYFLKETQFGRVQGCSSVKDAYDKERIAGGGNRATQAELKCMAIADAIKAGYIKR